MIKEIEEIDKMKEINKTYNNYGYGEGDGKIKIIKVKL